MRAHSRNMDIRSSSVDRNVFRGHQASCGCREITAFEKMIGQWDNNRGSSSGNNSLNDLEKLLTQLLEVIQARKEQQQQSAASYIIQLLQELSDLSERIDNVMNWAQSMRGLPKSKINDDDDDD